MFRPLSFSRSIENMENTFSNKIYSVSNWLLLQISTDEKQNSLPDQYFSSFKIFFNNWRQNWWFIADWIVRQLNFTVCFRSWWFFSFKISEELRSLLQNCGFVEEQNIVDRRLQVNRGKLLKMYRVWIQTKYRKPY